MLNGEGFAPSVPAGDAEVAAKTGEIKKEASLSDEDSDIDSADLQVLEPMIRRVG